MGFIPSGETITVQAYLTETGKKALHDRILVAPFFRSAEEAGVGLLAAGAALGAWDFRFITHFGLGDSDTNYNAIENGADVLKSGHVPIAGSFKSKPRSKVLYRGTYRPGIPRMLLNGAILTPFTIIPLSITSPIIEPSGDQVWRLRYGIRMEWPKGELFNESLRASASIPNLSKRHVRSWLETKNDESGDTHELFIQIRLDNHEQYHTLPELVEDYQDIVVNLEGRKTNKNIQFTIRFTNV